MKLNQSSLEACSCRTSLSKLSRVTTQTTPAIQRQRFRDQRWTHCLELTSVSTRFLLIKLVHLTLHLTRSCLMWRSMRRSHQQSGQILTSREWPTLSSVCRVKSILCIVLHVDRTMVRAAKISTLSTTSTLNGIILCIPTMDHLLLLACLDTTKLSVVNSVLRMNLTFKFALKTKHLRLLSTKFSQSHGVPIRLKELVKSVLAAWTKLFKDWSPSQTEATKVSLFRCLTSLMASSHNLATNLNRPKVH